MLREGGFYQQSLKWSGRRIEIERQIEHDDKLREQRVKKIETEPILGLMRQHSLILVLAFVVLFAEYFHRLKIKNWSIRCQMVIPRNWKRVGLKHKNLPIKAESSQVEESSRTDIKLATIGLQISNTGTDSQGKRESIPMNICKRNSISRPKGYLKHVRTVQANF